MIVSLSMLAAAGLFSNLVFLLKLHIKLETLPFNAFPRPGVTRVDPSSSTEAPAEEEPSKVQLPSLRIPHPSKPLERKPLNHNWRQP